MRKLFRQNATAKKLRAQSRPNKKKKKKKKETVEPE